MVADPWVCSSCYATGHSECLQASILEGYAFCINCKPFAIEQYSRFTTEAQRQRWAVRLAGQLANWREMTVNATGALGAVGLAIGGAGAMVVGGTAALVRGAVQGACASTHAASPATLQDAAPPEPEEASTAEAQADSRPNDSGRGPSALGCHGIADSTRGRSRSEQVIPFATLLQP